MKRIFLASVLSAGSLMTLATTTHAQNVTRKNPTNPNVAIITQLRGTVATLQQADHDYEGHRVKAIHHIHTAVRVLRPGKGVKVPGKKTPAPKVAPGAKQLPQDASDQLLRQGLQQLQTIHTALNSGNFPNRAAAASAVQNAINELQTALKIR